MKTLLVTGGSRGIGEAIVRAAVKCGYQVAFTFNTGSDRAAKIEEELGGAAVAFRLNVADPAMVNETVAKIVKRLGKIDALVNNAGVAGDKLFQDVDDADWKKMFAVNTDGVFYVTKAVVSDMISRKQGSIVNVSSMWGQTGASMETCYSATKAAVIGLTKALAKELAPSGITVNAVAPGAIDTDMLSCYTAAELSALAEEIPLGRLGTPEDVADAVTYLLSAPYVTGQVLGVNGGYVI